MAKPTCTLHITSWHYVRFARNYKMTPILKIAFEAKTTHVYDVIWLMCSLRKKIHWFCRSHMNMMVCLQHQKPISINILD